MAPFDYVIYGQSLMKHYKKVPYLELTLVQRVFFKVRLFPIQTLGVYMFQENSHFECSIFNASFGTHILHPGLYQNSQFWGPFFRMNFFWCWLSSMHNFKNSSTKPWKSFSLRGCPERLSHFLGHFLTYLPAHIRFSPNSRYFFR